MQLFSLPGADKTFVFRYGSCHGDVKNGAIYSSRPPLPSGAAPLPLTADSYEPSDCLHPQRERRRGDVSPALLAVPSCPHYITSVDASVCDYHVTLEQAIVMAAKTYGGRKEDRVKACAHLNFCASL